MKHLKSSATVTVHCLNVIYVYYCSAGCFSDIIIHNLSAHMMYRDQQLPKTVGTVILEVTKVKRQCSESALCRSLLITIVLT